MDYLLPENLSPDSFREQLRAFASLRPGPAHDVRRVFLDSFDWRLHRRQLVLEELTEKRATILHLRELGSRRTVARAETRAPRFAHELPPGPLREILTELLEMRSLLPLAGTITRSHPLSLLNKDRKTVVGLSVDEHRVEGKPGQPPAIRVRLLPVRGYAKPLRKLDSHLRMVMGLKIAEEDFWAEAMRAADHRPGDYSSKLNPRLDPEQTAALATREILRHLLAAMDLNLEGVIRDLDSEFLHDFRVAARRTRVALGQLKETLPATVLETFRPEFAWLGGVTGPTRDLDVYLLGFDRYRDRLPPEIREDLSPLREFLIERRRSAQRALAGELTSTRYRQLIEAWRKWLEAPLTADDGLQPAAGLPARKVADKSIGGMLRRALGEGHRITDQSPAEELHELRKTCKKLRYLLEFFQSLYPREAMTPLLKTLKGLQDHLGEFQDLEVHWRALRDFSQQMSSPRPVPPATLVAMGMLAEGLRNRQQRIRGEFAKRFAEFAGPHNRRLFRELFGKGKRPP